MRTRHRPMRQIHQPVEALGLIASQPRMQRLPRYPDLRRTCQIDKPSLMTANTA